LTSVSDQIHANHIAFCGVNSSMARTRSRNELPKSSKDVNPNNEEDELETDDEYTLENNEQSEDVEEHVDIPEVQESPPQKKSKKKASKKIEFNVLHPNYANIWEETKIPAVLVNEPDFQQPSELKVTLLPFQKEGLNWMQTQEDSTVAGGILADEMGMGKTIQMIALMISRKLDGATLIVCPTVALLQWSKEILERVVPGVFNVMVFHGTSRPTSTKEILKYNVVLTSYAIIEQGHRKEQYGVKRQGELVKLKSVLHSIQWGRAILDEADVLLYTKVGHQR
jgi:DNA repair protein RAD16